MNQVDLSSACSLAEKVNNGEVTAVSAVKACLENIYKSADLNNFITVCEGEALEAAERVDTDVKNGKRGMLAGVPIAVKDNICCRGIKTTCASRIMSDFVPDFDAEVILRLKRAGAVIVGKTNMDEFAFGSANEYSAYGAVKNARDKTRVAGGSSGGSANAVAAGQVALALGTDTGGSVRQPAAYCGVVGLKPTFGAIEKKGVIGMCPSLEQVGTISKSCDDAALLFSVLSGRDIPRTLDGIIAGKTIGVAAEFINSEMSEEMKTAFFGAVETLKALGAKIAEVSVPSFPFGLAAYHVLSSAVAVNSFKRVFKQHAQTELLGDEVKRRLFTGAVMLSGDNYDDLYIKAAKVRTVIKCDYDNALNCCDALLCPTSSHAATKVGEVIDPHKGHMCDSFLAPVSLAGLPAVSVPFGSENSLPLGVQIIGRRNAEFDILNIGTALTTASK